MTGLAIAAGAVAAVAFLKWAVKPILVAFELGRVFERGQRKSKQLRAAQEAARWN